MLSYFAFCRQLVKKLTARKLLRKEQRIRFRTVSAAVALFADISVVQSGDIHRFTDRDAVNFDVVYQRREIFERNSVRNQIAAGEFARVHHFDCIVPFVDGIVSEMGIPRARDGGLFPQKQAVGSLRDLGVSGGIAQQDDSAEGPDAVNGVLES